jgi:hypothetical protein
MLKKIKHFLIPLLLTLFLLEIGSRIIVSTDNDGNYMVLGKKTRYILPFKYDQTKKHETKKEGYRVYDSLLGWSHGYWQNQTIYFSDNLGNRCSESIFNSKTSTPYHQDIICIGDSFTHGDAVVFEETWPYLLSKKMQRSVVNMGVGGYGIDQAVLRFMNSKISCDTVVFGIVSGDFERSLTTVYNYYSGGVKTKPRFKFKKESSSFKLVNVPCISPDEFIARPISSRAKEVYDHIEGNNSYQESESKIWTQSMFLRILFSTIEQKKRKKPPVYMTQGEDFEYCMQIMDVFKKFCKEEKIVPIILLIDNNNTFTDRENTKKNTWKYLKNRLKEKELTCLEFQDLFYQSYIEKSESVIHKTEGVHYSASGHELLANTLTKYIK